MPIPAPAQINRPSACLISAAARSKFCAFESATAELPELTSFLFGRPAAAFSLRRELSLLSRSDARRKAGFAFFVHGLGFRGAAAQRMQSLDGDDEALLAAADFEFIADADFLSRLDAAAVPFDMAGVHCLGAKAARLEEARRPQPGS